MQKFGETATLRGRLREDWPAGEFGELVWVEAAPGGTVGAPDVFLPLGDRGYLPVELKGWSVTRAGRIVYRARPAQRRFHALAALAGQRTAFLAVLPSGEIVLQPGGHFGEDGFISRIGRDTSLRVLWVFFKSESFWKGK